MKSGDWQRGGLTGSDEELLFFGGPLALKGDLRFFVATGHDHFACAH